MKRARKKNYEFWAYVFLFSWVVGGIAGAKRAGGGGVRGSLVRRLKGEKGKNGGWGVFLFLKKGGKTRWGGAFGEFFFFFNNK